MVAAATLRLLGGVGFWMFSGKPAAELAEGPSRVPASGPVTDENGSSESEIGDLLPEKSRLRNVEPGDPAAERLKADNTVAGAKQLPKPETDRSPAKRPATEEFPANTTATELPAA